MSEKTTNLLKKEAEMEKGSGTPHLVKIANLAIEQIIKIAKEKKDSMITNSMKASVKNVVGSCGPLGILVESKEPKQICSEIDNGVYDKEINEERTEVDNEKKQMLKDNLIKINIILAKEKEALEIEEKETSPVKEVVEEESKKEETGKKTDKKPEDKKEKKEVKKK